MISQQVVLQDGCNAAVVQDISSLSGRKPYFVAFPILYADGEWPRYIDHQCMTGKSPREIYAHIKDMALAASQLCSTFRVTGKGFDEQTYVVRDEKDVLLSCVKPDQDTYSRLAKTWEYGMCDREAGPFLAILYDDNVFQHVRSQILTPQDDANVVTTGGLFLHRVGDPFTSIQAVPTRYDVSSQRIGVAWLRKIVDSLLSRT